jgi:hypothetical protein
MFVPRMDLGLSTSKEQRACRSLANCVVPYLVENVRKGVYPASSSQILTITGQVARCEILKFIRGHRHREGDGKRKERG